MDRTHIKFTYLRNNDNCTGSTEFACTRAITQHSHCQRGAVSAETMLTRAYTRCACNRQCRTRTRPKTTHRDCAATETKRGWPTSPDASQAIMSAESRAFRTLHTFCVQLGMWAENLPNRRQPDAAQCLLYSCVGREWRSKAHATVG